jgi:conjugative relaxase-like TrwC/TraI family protein
MLSMSNVKNVGSASSYYAEDNYYTKDENREMSVWAGKGAEALGLVGPVDPEDFTMVLAGQIGEFGLGRIVGKTEEGELIREHRPGFDVTLSAPKSVSLVAEVLGVTEVRQAHEAAVTKVLEYMENRLAQARVTENGETTTVPTGNLIVGRFHHTTSRDLDPQTHTHLVIANATQLEDGRWRSISNELIYQNQKLLGAIYDTELAANLRELGYRLESTGGGRWEIAGIDREQIEHFSQRSQALEDRLKEFGLTRETATAAQREDAALRTRDSKSNVDHDALKDEWRARADAIGVDFLKIEQDREQGKSPPTDPAITTEKADEAVRFAVAHLTERQSVVSSEEIFLVALEHAIKEAPWSGVTYEQVEVALAARLVSKEVLNTVLGDITTQEALDRERHMLAMLEHGRGVLGPVMASERVDAGVVTFEETKTLEHGSPFKLTAGQEEAARVTLTSEDRFIGLQGYAGVGKTTMLELVRILAEDAGYQVRGMAPSAMAAMTMENESGIVSVTTARFLIDEGRRAMEEAKPKSIALEVFGAVDFQGNDWRTLSIELPVKKLDTAYASKEMWVMDEASLSGQREMTQLMEMANKAGARLVLVGDALQLNAVEAGKPFEMLQKAGIDGALMSDINRQQVEDLKMAVAAAVVRQNDVALHHLRERIVEVGDSKELYRKVAEDILEKHPSDRDKALIIVPRNAARHAINRLVREGLQERGDIMPDEARRDVLVPSGYTDAQKGSTPYYEPGMVVRFGREYRSLGTKLGEYGTVTQVENRKHSVKLKMEDGRTITWSPEKHSKVEAYEVESRELGIGDELRFTRNNKELAVNNGTLGKVSEIAGDRIVLETTKGPITLHADLKSESHWEYAYAMTVYASQGRTTNDANFLLTKDSGKAMGERSFYVGITRPRTDMTIYTDSKEHAMKMVQLLQDKTSAVEHFSPRDLIVGPKMSDDTGNKNVKGGQGGRDASAER